MAKRFDKAVHKKAKAQTRARSKLIAAG